MQRIGIGRGVGTSQGESEPNAVGRKLERRHDPAWVDWLGPRESSHFAGIKKKESARTRRVDRESDAAGFVVHCEAAYVPRNVLAEPFVLLRFQVEPRELFEFAARVGRDPGRLAVG